MKTIKVLSLTAVPISAAALVARDPQGILTSLFGGGNGPASIANIATATMPVAKLASVEQIKPQIRPGTKRLVAKYGPYELSKTVQDGQRKPFLGRVSLDPNGQAFANTITKGLCSNCTILAGKTDLVLEDGRPATLSDGIYVHHLISADLSKGGEMPISKCESTSENERAPALLGAGFIGQGTDGNELMYFTTKDGKYESGFLVGKEDRFLLVGDLVNSSPETKKVYVTFEIEYVDGHLKSDAINTLLSVVGCRTAQPKLNKDGPSVTDSGKFPIYKNGAIVAAKGHMHNGGDSMIMYINNKEVCRSDSVYGKQGKDVSIVGMTACDKVIPVKKGDFLTMESVYDLSKYPLRKGLKGDDHVHDVMGGDDVMGMWSITMSIDR